MTTGDSAAEIAAKELGRAGSYRCNKRMLRFRDPLLVLRKRYAYMSPCVEVAIVWLKQTQCAYSQGRKSVVLSQAVDVNECLVHSMSRVGYHIPGTQKC